MANGWRLNSRLAAIWLAYAAALSSAHAQGVAPAITGNGWIAIAIILGLVVLVVLVISGAINISGRDAPDEDGAGFGVLEEIDEDDEDRKKKR